MVGEKIKRIREVRGYSQEYMADQLSMSVSAYGKIERGETGLSFEKAKSIAQILAVTLLDLDEFDDSKSVHIYQNNTLHHCQQGETHIYGGLSENERRLYEDKIKLMELLLNEKGLNI